MSASAMYALAWLAACASVATLAGALCYRIGLESAGQLARDASEAFDEGRDDGFSAGHAQGLVEGRREGEADGYARGHADGKRVGRAEVLTKIQATAELLAHPKGACGS